jgi:hypothetical protein
MEKPPKTHLKVMKNIEKLKIQLSRVVEEFKQKLLIRKNNLDKNGKWPSLKSSLECDS